MKDFQKTTNDIVKKFPSKFSKEQRFIDLTEELGELAQAILFESGVKKNKIKGEKTKDDIADALADMLFNMYDLAEQYGIDLDREYSEMLERLKERIEKGEFK
ncbi:MAG: hypothetical protein PF572_03970 [Patescibacteria group bacterium]|jgi:NTP pyrophosphatase (non-canonical NTP hydrolase)|nr:hypothetical protein [Patescibacteria group bacterium]